MQTRMAAAKNRYLSRATVLSVYEREIEAHMVRKEHVTTLALLDCLTTINCLW